MWLITRRVVDQLFTIAVVLLVFANLHGRTEILMAAFAGLIVVTIRGSWLGTLLLFHDLRQEIDALKTAVVAPSSEQPVTGLHASIENVMDRRSFAIRFLGTAVVSLICLVELFLVLSGRMS
jgi:hypothetical protein